MPKSFIRKAESEATDWNWKPIAVRARNSTARINHLSLTGGPPTLLAA
jgi:hypothetical protein